MPAGRALTDSAGTGDRLHWLTSERLVWMPKDSEPVQIPLRSIREDGVSFPFGGGVRVVGERESLTLTLYGMKQLRSLQLLLEMRRRPPLLGSAATERLADVVCYPATLQSGYSRKGFVVLRPGYAAFFPMEAAGEALMGITGSGPSPSPFNMPLFGIPTIIEQLRYLPSEAAFDACVERAVTAAGGERWGAEEVLRYDATLPVVKRLHFQTLDSPSRSLSGKVDPREQEATERILAAWPRR